MNQVTDRRKQGDRRKSPRYQVASAEAFLGWWDGPEFRTELVRTEDISAGGVRLSSSGTVVPSQELWLRFTATPTLDWVQARLVGTLTDRNQQDQLRLEFPNECPYEVLKALAWSGATTTDCRAPAARSFRLATNSPSFRLAPEDPTPCAHKSFRLTPVSLGGRRPAPTNTRSSPLPTHPRPTTNVCASPAVSHPAESPEPQPSRQPPPSAALADVCRQGPLTVVSSYRATRHELNRVNLLTSGVRFLSIASIITVLWVVLTQEYGRIRPLVVIVETINK
jgi:PilZ domain